MHMTSEEGAVSGGEAEGGGCIPDLHELLKRLDRPEVDHLPGGPRLRTGRLLKAVLGPFGTRREDDPPDGRGVKGHLRRDAGGVDTAAAEGRRDKVAVRAVERIIRTIT